MEPGSQESMLSSTAVDLCRSSLLWDRHAAGMTLELVLAHLVERIKSALQCVWIVALQACRNSTEQFRPCGQSAHANNDCHICAHCMPERLAGVANCMQQGKLHSTQVSSVSDIWLGLL